MGPLAPDLMTIDEARACLLRILRAVKHRDQDAAPGFADDTVRTISENAKTFRFKDFGWEKE
jgi:hypothetical protein